MHPMSRGKNTRQGYLNYNTRDQEAGNGCFSGKIDAVTSAIQNEHLTTAPHHNAVQARRLAAGYRC